MSLNNLSYDHYYNIAMYIDNNTLKNIIFMSKKINNMLKILFLPVETKNLKNVLINIENEQKLFCYNEQNYYYQNNINNQIVKSNCNISALIFFYDILGNKLFDLFFEFNTDNCNYIMNKNKIILSYFEIKHLLLFAIPFIITPMDIYD